jgi:hypothetical protein
MPLSDDTDGDARNDTAENSGSSSTSLVQELFLFYLLFNIERRKMEYLLKLLCKFGIDVPKSTYLLQKMSEQIDLGEHVKKISEISKSAIVGGSMAYLTIADNLKFLYAIGYLKKIPSTIIGSIQHLTLNLKFNIDGLPLFGSSAFNLWPILVSINDCHPLPVACYGGIGKPNITEFLQNFATELQQLLTNGWQHESTFVTFNPPLFICDSPARAFVMNILGHNAHLGCGYCRCQGECVEGRTVFPSVIGASRTDEKYKELKENNQIERSPLDFLSLRSCFPPEPMHLVCLGVIRRLFYCYFTKIKGLNLPCRLSSSQVDELSGTISSWRLLFPSTFQRSIRSISYLQNFKAVE